jgi:hypothetical protein
MPETNYVRLKEDGGIGRARRGAVLMVVGRVLLWMDVLLAMFVYVGIRSGSHFWTWWVLGEAFLGLALIVVGRRMRAQGIVKDETHRRAA